MEGFITFLIIIIVFFIWIFYSGQKTLQKIEQEKQERFKKENIKYEFKLEHIAGYPYPSYCNVFTIKNDNTFYINDHESHQIPIENIKRIEVKTEEQLHKDITIPRMLIGGIFALAKPKKTIEITNYLYLSYINSGIEIDCLFKGYPNTNLGKLTSLINQLRIEKNKKNVINIKECVN